MMDLNINWAKEAWEKAQQKTKHNTERIGVSHRSL